MRLRHDTADSDNVRFAGGIAKRVLVGIDERVLGGRWVTGNEKKCFRERTLAIPPPYPYDALAPPPSYVHPQWPGGMCALP